VYNNADGMVTMAGEDASITIPAIFLTQTDGQALNAAVTTDPSIVVNIHCGTDTNFPPNPCTDGVTLVDSGEVFLSGLSSGQDCNWAMSCSDAALVPALTFASFQIEAGFDFLYLYNAVNTAGDASMDLHGGIGDATAPDATTPVTVATGPVMVARYVSDGWVDGEGFLATLSCIEAVADCTNENLVLDWAGNFHASGHAVFGAQVVFSSDLSEVQVVVADPLSGCVGDESTGEASPTGLINAADMVDKIALIQSGGCHFTTKVENAQNAGAVAVVVYNNADGMVNMAAAAGMGGSITIPSIFITLADGQALSDAVTADPSMITSLHCGPESLHMDSPCDAGGLSMVDFGPIILGGLSSSNQLCQWGMTCSNADQVVTVTFSAFSVESNYDWLEVYESADATGDYATRFTGTNPDGLPWTSTGPTASLQYDSDGSVNGPGFVGTFACAPPPPPPSACTQAGGVAVGAGDTITMPPPGEAMAVNQLCTWTATCPDGQAPELSFTAFDIEAGWDYLYIDSTGDGSYNMQESGGGPSAPIAGSAASNVYTYSSDGWVDGTGFTGTVACVDAVPPPPPDPCNGGMALSPGDTFTSPNYPSNYLDNRNCVWTMDCPTGTPTVTFTTTAEVTEACAATTSGTDDAACSAVSNDGTEATCTSAGACTYTAAVAASVAFNLENYYDYVHFDLTGNGQADESLTGTNPEPNPVTGSAGTPLLAAFMSDSSSTRAGFEATFTCP
jgi:hypothetical protein